MFVTVVTLGLALFYASRGFDSGFVDMGHDGYVLKVATDLCDGSILFKDIFTQYGILGDRLNCAILQMSDSSALMTLKNSYAFIYAISLGSLTYLTTRWAGAGWGWCAGIFAVLSAPFFRHGIMLSVHVFILPLAIMTVASLHRFSQAFRVRWAVLAGALSGFVFLLKQNIGVYQFLAVLGVVLLLSLCVSTERSPSGVARAVAGVLMGTLLLVGGGVALTWFEGGLSDWWLQTIVFPREFYANQMPTEFGSPTQQSLARLNLDVANLVPRAFWLPFDMFRDQSWWFLLRAGIFIIGLVGLRSRQTRSPSIVLVVFSMAAYPMNFPSYNFMHQWWSLVPLLPLVPLCLRKRSISIDYHASTDMARGTDTHGILSKRVVVSPSDFMRQNSRVLVAGAIYSVTALAAIGTLLGQGNRFSLSAGNLSFSTLANALRTCSPMPVGSKLEGICTEPAMRRSLMEVADALHDTRLKYGEINGTPAHVISIETEEGVEGISRSLLPIAILEDNSSQYPALWQMPGLREIYPSAIERAQEGGWVLLDYGPASSDRHVPGFKKIWTLDWWDSSAVDKFQAWSIFVPDRLVSE